MPNIVSSIGLMVILFLIIYSVSIDGFIFYFMPLFI